MIRKSVRRFSEKIMLKQKPERAMTIHPISVAPQRGAGRPRRYLPGRDGVSSSRKEAWTLAMVALPNASRSRLNRS
jgi:hypothetical protein